MQHEKIYIQGMAKQVTHLFSERSQIYPRIGDQGGMVYSLERLDEIRPNLASDLQAWVR